MKINRKQKELIKVYIFLFALIFTIINWDNISWLFNYRAISGLAYDFLNPYPESNFISASSTTISPAAIVIDNGVQSKKIYPYSGKSNSIEISTIGIVAPIVIGESTDSTVLEKNLNQGTVVYPGSVVPSENGQTIILGHSAPPNWPKIRYDWVFSEINNLNFGNEIVLNFNNRQYIYRVIRKDIVDKGQEISTSTLNGKNNILVLVSCWPPGKNYKRIAVQAELIN